jgi:excisionase family DNA binding protein
VTESAAVAGWLSVREAAAYAGVGETEVRAAIDARTLPAVTTHPEAPGRWMVRRADVDAWVTRR